jgi:hypothetical protein
MNSTGSQHYWYSLQDLSVSSHHLNDNASPACLVILQLHPHLLLYLVISVYNNIDAMASLENYNHQWCVGLHAN